jgi:hypothetical protein
LARYFYSRLCGKKKFKSHHTINFLLPNIMQMAEDKYAIFLLSFVFIQRYQKIRDPFFIIIKYNVYYEELFEADRRPALVCVGTIKCPDVSSVTVTTTGGNALSTITSSSPSSVVAVSTMGLPGLHIPPGE